MDGTPTTPSLIADTLLGSAHGLNLPGGAGSDRNLYGAGEACLSRALAPLVAC